ncbi:MAG: tetratricopeptide repeat protein [Gammaproteobacteria bacterium]|nr:tetratricopeptide repeat protein [Gammaproteobacteria bacterium]
MDRGVVQSLKYAAERREQGNTAAAISVLQQAVKQHPEEPECLLELGKLFASQHDFEAAIESYQQIIKAMPSHVAAWKALAATYFHQHNYVGAVKSLQQVLKFQPDDLISWNNLGLAQMALGEVVRATQSLKRALKLQPKNITSWYNLGVTLVRQKRYADAFDCFQRVLQLDPNHIDAMINLGAVLVSQGQINEAVRCYKRALKKQPDNINALHNIAVAYGKFGDYKAAINYYHAALKCQPNFIRSLYNLALIFDRTGNYATAAEYYQRVLKLNPKHLGALNNLGLIYYKQGKLDQSCQYYEKALALKPNVLLTLTHLGAALTRKDCLQKAIEYFNRALKLDACYALANYNLAECLLLQGKWQQAWDYYEWRLDLPMQTLDPRFKHAARWHSGMSAKGKHIIVVHEQNDGDNLMALRYLDLLVKRGAKITFLAKPKMLTLLKGVKKIDLLSARESLPDFDYYVPLLSLAKEFNATLSDIFPPTEKIKSAKLTAELEPYFNKVKQLKIGVNSQNTSKLLNDLFQSADFHYFSDLIKNFEAKFYHLPADLNSNPKSLKSAEPRLVQLPKLNDYSELAGVIKQLDLVITVDSAVAHLAGLMNKPVWLLLPYVPDWRWQLKGQTTPWYPSFKLFRQPNLMDWDSVFKSVLDALAKI